MPHPTAIHVHFRAAAPPEELQRRLEEASDLMKGEEGLLQHFWMRELKGDAAAIGGFFVFDTPEAMRRFADGAALSEALRLPAAPEHTPRREYELLTALHPSKAQQPIREGLGLEGEE